MTGETPMLSRSNAHGDHQKVELRGMAPASLAAALDALAMAEDQDRNAYVVKVLEGHVREQLHKASLLNRVLRGNAYLTEAHGGSAE